MREDHDDLRDKSPRSPKGKLIPLGPDFPTQELGEPNPYLQSLQPKEVVTIGNHPGMQPIPVELEERAHGTQTLSSKDTNPKDAIGMLRVPYSTISAPVLAEVGVAMYEGARKYGRHNYRIAGVKASVYYDAVVARHLAAWWEGEDIDAKSDMHHVTKAIAGLIVLRDAMIQDKFIDDRPPRTKAGWLEALDKKMVEITNMYPKACEPFTQAQLDQVSAAT